MIKLLASIGMLVVALCATIIATSSASTSSKAPTALDGSTTAAPKLTLSNDQRQDLQPAGLVPGALPEQPEVDWVDFTNNTEVIVDTQKNEPKAPEEGLLITEWPAEDSSTVEWEASGGTSTKNWPVAYPEETGGKPTKMRVDAHFALGAGTKNFLENNLEKETKIVGEITLNGTKLEFEEKYPNPSEVATEVQSNGYLTLGDVESNVALPQKVAVYAKIGIAWKLIGEAGKKTFNEPMGESKHNIFVTYKTPSTNQSQTFLSLLYLATKGIEKTNLTPNETEAIAGTWSVFSGAKVEPVEYNVASGTINAKPGGTLEYYKNEAPPGQTAETEIKKGLSCANTTVGLLLKSKEGQCGAWASAFGYSLGYEGIHSKKIEISVNFGKPSECEPGGDCYLLVKKWLFKACPLMKKAPFTYKSNELTDEAGAPGQGTTDPDSIFMRHFLVLQGKTLYDPSYATTPITKATLGEAVEQYEGTYIAGFCQKSGAMCGEESEAPKKALEGTSVYEY